MKQTFEKHLIEFAVLSIVLLIVSLVSLIKVDYTLTAPGYNNEVGDFIEIESSYQVDGGFYTTSVIVLDRMTYLQFLIGNIEPKVDVSEIPEFYDNINLDDLTVMGYQSKDDSLATSLVVGISRAGYNITYETYWTVYLTYNYLDDNTLELGDKLLSVNGLEPTLGLADVACDEVSVFVVMRDDEQLTFNVRRNQLDSGICAYGAYIKPYTEVLTSEIDYTLVETNTGGASGGLLQALYIYNILTPNDITGGLQIAGTGTMSPEGDVGKIGGIEQKIITSAMNGIDIFFVPYLSDDEDDNYIEALRVMEGLETEMILVPVTTMDQAVSYLEVMFGGAFDE